MPNTYTQLHIHIVFAVKFRAAMIQPPWEVELHKYITAIVTNNGHKLLCINSVPDHLHMFVGLNPNQSISTMMSFVKGDSSEFINNKQFTKRKFNWQAGYGAFSNSHSQIDSIVKYIKNQKVHHRKQTFKEEYVNMLQKAGVAYDDKYIFKDLSDD